MLAKTVKFQVEKKASDLISEERKIQESVNESVDNLADNDEIKVTEGQASNRSNNMEEITKDLKTGGMNGIKLVKFFCSKLCGCGKKVKKTDQAIGMQEEEEA
jgi:hypothetical protein